MIYTQTIDYCIIENEKRSRVRFARKSRKVKFDKQYFILLYYAIVNCIISVILYNIK